MDRRRIHTCNICKRKFTAESSLTRHMKIHVQDFPSVTWHLDKKSKKQESKSESSVSQFKQDANNAIDAELLAAAESMLGLSTAGELTPAASQDPNKMPGSSAQQETFVSASIHLEGWQKSWEQPPPSSQALGIAPPNIKWLKYNEKHGLFEKSSEYQNARGEIVERKLLKDQMKFHPPPIPVTVEGAVSNMLDFFTTPAFFWRPVGVMEAMIRCPNTNCPAPPGEYLQKNGFAACARQVCGMRYNYTLLTEKLKCPHCERIRQGSATREREDESQYMWLAYSPMILMQLAPAIRRMFPAILCGRHAIDKEVVTLLNDRLNAISVSKVQRLLQEGHNEWYMERRDLYQTLLYEAHTAGSSASASSSSSSSQRGIPSYVKPAGTYTPPIPKSPLPSARVLRRAHLIMEMENMDVYRNQILSVTGEILCIDGTRKVLEKIDSDGQGTIQYITSVLNEWGQILTTVVVAAESEECYKRMARGLMARFERAKVPAPKVIYADNSCCHDKGSFFLENLFSDWVQRGTVVRLDIRHWLNHWDVVIIQNHAKYKAFMNAMAGAVLAYNMEDIMLLVQAVRSGNRDLYTEYNDEEMIPFLKSHQIKSYVRCITRGIEETASAMDSILDEFKGPAGLDINGIHLFKSAEAVDSHWATASRHLGCMQDPPGIALYVAVKTVALNGVQLTKYRCQRGSDSLEDLHAHLYNAIPSQRCGIIPFQVYLISFAVQWNTRMESLQGSGGQGQQNTCMDPWQIQRMNQQAEVLFGKDYTLEPNFAAHLPYPEEYGNLDEEELLGVEYAMCQSTPFTPRQFYAQKAVEEQSCEEEEESSVTTAGDTQELEELMSDEDLFMSLDDPIDGFSVKYAVFTNLEQVEEDSPSKHACNVSGKGSGEKRRIDLEELQPGPGPSEQPMQLKPPAAASHVPPAVTSHVPPTVSPAPILLVVPAQPQAPSIQFTEPSYSQVLVPVKQLPALTLRPIMHNKLRRPCAACKVPQCGGKRKRYTPSKDKVSGSSQKMFTFCPVTNQSITPGFEGLYDGYDHFKLVVDKELEKRKTN